MAAVGVTMHDACNNTQGLLPAPPPAVATALLGTVREPTPDQLASWTTIEHVATWAKLKGDITWPPSMAGSLIRLMAGDDEGPADIGVS